MEVKGTAVISTREFVKANFGEQNLNKWMSGFDPQTKKIYESAILTNNWYPIEDALRKPTKKIGEMFYGGDIRKGAWDCGMFSADYGLKGIYRLFVKMGSAKFIINKASSIFSTYYKPSVMQSEVTGDNSSVLRIVEFADICPVVESRIGGWMHKGLEICGVKDINVEMVKAKTKGDAVTEYAVSWSDK